MKRLVLLFLLPFLFISCGQDPMTRSNDTATGALTQKAKVCTCTFDYQPVCANGTTYDNKCIAECNGVSSFSVGACNCNVKSGYLCAQPPMPTCDDGEVCSEAMPSLQTYLNECEMVKEGAEYRYMGVCN